MKHCFVTVLTTIVLVSGNQLAYAQQPATPAEPVYAVVDKMPRFKSTDSTTSELLGYISRSRRYPVEALQDRATGRLFVSFVVSKMGRVE